MYDGMFVIRDNDIETVYIDVADWKSVRAGLRKYFFNVTVDSLTELRARKDFIVTLLVDHVRSREVPIDDIVDFHLDVETIIAQTLNERAGDELLRSLGWTYTHG